MNSKVYGYLLGAVAAASYGTIPLFTLPLMHSGISAGSILFLRYCIAIPILAIMMTARGRGFGIRRAQWPPVIFMGLTMGISSLTLLMSYNYIGASIASTLLFMYPVLVTVIMALFYHEKASWMTLVCIAVAMSGIMLLYHGDGETLSTTGVLLVACSALSYAVYLVGCNRPRLTVIPTLKLTFYVIVFGLLLFIPLFDTYTLTILNGDIWLWMAAIGLASFPTAVSLLATSAAIQRIGSTPVAILGALEPVTAVIIAVGIFNEPLTLRLSAGMALVITAVTLIISGDSVMNAMIRVRKMFPRITHHR